MEYPPGPSTNNLFPTFRRDPLKTLMDIANTYGEISHFRFGSNQHVYLIDNPDYIEDILVDKRRIFLKRKGLKGKERKGLFGNGIMFSQGEFHDRQRKLIQPLFYPKQIKNYSDIVTEYSLSLSDLWKDGSIMDIHNELMYVTLAILCKSVLSYEINRDYRDEIGNSILTALEYHQHRQIQSGSTGRNEQFRTAIKKLDSLVYNMIKQYRQEEANYDAEANNKNRSKDAKKINENLLSSLIHTQYVKAAEAASNQNQPMSDLQLRDEIMTIMIAGHDPVANALTWTFYLISQHADVEARLDLELKSVFQDEGNIPSFEDIPKLQYTEKVLKEALRLFPPAWSINRTNIKDCMMGRYLIPAGSTIITSPYVTHRNPLHFKDPHKFVPERWTEEFSSQLPRFSYFPFGGGARSCVGESFAWMEGILILATIVRRWKMIHPPDHTIEFYYPIITLRPKNGMYMKLERKT